MTREGAEISQVAWDHLTCPRCASARVRISPSGLQSMVARLKGLRLYSCNDCGRHFNAGDRRRFSRKGPLAQRVIRKTC